MQNSIEFSVLISIYKEENPEFFKRALESIWDDQLLKPDEIVLVKDGELTKFLNSIINDWKAKIGDVLKIVELKSNIGLGGALNRGIDYCSNTWIARMDADDIAMPSRFKKQIGFVEQNPEVDILSSWAMDIDGKGNVLRTRKVPKSHKDIIDLLWAVPIIHPAVLYKKSSIIKAGYYSEDLFRSEDFELWFRCARNGSTFANLQEPLVYYRFSDDYFKKNNLRAGIVKLRVGIRESWNMNASYKAYLGVTIPFLRALLPQKLNNYFQRIINRFDPRN